MPLTKTIPVGMVIALTLGAAYATEQMGSSSGESRSRATAMTVARAFPLSEVHTAEAEGGSRAKLDRRFPLDDLHKLCGYSYAQFEAVVSPRHIREYARTMGRTVIVGTDSSNFLLGTPNDDLILGFGGVDRIVAQGGDDLVCGGLASDRIFGGSGHDRIVSGPGSDYLG